MIFDKIENAENYFSFHPLFKNAFEFLKKDDLDKLAFSVYELDDKDLYAIISCKQGKTKFDSKLEAHRKYIDIQFLIKGDEQIGWKAYQDCKHVEHEFNEEKDIEFFSDPSQTYLNLLPGTFAIFYPWDSHAPMISEGEVHKVVIKVKL